MNKIKTNISKIAASLSLLAVCFSCSESVVDLHKGESPLVISVDKSELVLDVASSTSKALTFSWTSGTNEGTNCAISYELIIDRKGNNFTGGYDVDMGRRQYSLEVTHTELNNIMMSYFGGQPGVSIDLEAVVIATPSSDLVEVQTADPVSFTVTPFKPLPEQLFMIGGATSGGWTLEDASEMSPVSGSPGCFVWTGTLNAGEMKFVVSKDGYLPSYNRDGDSENKLICRESDDDPDEKFIIPSYGKYRVAVDLIDLSVTIESGSDPRFENIWFVGSFTNWSFVPMRRDPSNPFVFRYSEVFVWNGGGEFKFGTADGSWDNMYHPSIANAPYTHSEVIFTSPDDNKWFLPEADCGKPYKLSLDITEGAETMVMSLFVPYEELWLVGDATPGGWTLDDATPMTKTGDYTFEWTGTLNAGEMKITCDKKGDWMGAWFMSSAEGEAPTGEEQIMTFVDKANNPTESGTDRKWVIGESGTYTITLNQLYETIKIAKQ